MKSTQQDKIKKILKEKGCIDNFYCIENKISIRLGAIIHILRAQGWEFDDVKSGFIPGTKNWRYILKRTAPEYEWITIEKNGMPYAKRVLKSAGASNYREGGKEEGVERPL